MTTTVAAFIFPGVLAPLDRDGIGRSAEIAGVYRLSLARWWHDGLSCVVWIGLNPSTADGSEDDPTTRREVSFSQSWNYVSMLKLNISPYRATNPDDLRYVDEPLVPEGYHARVIATCKEAPKVMLAFGKPPGVLRLHTRNLLNGLRAARIPLWCLGKTDGGWPKHPLYVRATQPVERWS